MKNLVNSYAWIYLDPGSGSFILQILLAALLGGAYAVKVYWKKIKGWFSHPSIQGGEEESKTDQNHG